jgi:hypothetical protein
MAMRMTGLWAVMMIGLLLVGCNEPAASTGDSQTSTALAPPPAGDPMPMGTPAPPPADDTTRIVAQPGVGEKGNYESKGYISTLIHLRFQATDPIVFAQVKRGINDYHILNQRYPKSHEEFWKEVIEANNIRLPELAEGEKYEYDPKKAEETRGEEALFVLIPKK